MASRPITPPMKILSIDTTMAACSAAIVDTEAAQPLAEAFLPMERGHAEALAPMVDHLMRQSGLALSQIDRIAVTVGPGTFTGVRIGLSFARGLGVALGIPIIGIDSLSAIATNAPEESPLLVVLDARNDDVYAALFDASRRLIAGPLLSKTGSAAEMAPSETLLLGTASHTLRAVSGRSDLRMSKGSDLPIAAHFARLAARAEPAGIPAPLYLRAADAKPQATALRKIETLCFETADQSTASLLAVLHADAFEEGWTAAAFEGLLSLPGTAALIAMERGEPLAFILTRRAADEAEIITLGTRIPDQRRGVAQQLIGAQMERLKAAGVLTIFLEVATSNDPARALYGKVGFVEAGLRKDYYRRNGFHEDALVLRKEL